MHRARIQPLGVAPKGPNRRHVVEALTAALLVFGLLVFDGGISVAGAAPAPGSLYSWGDNYYGEVGDGTTTDHLSPEMIALASGVTPTAIAAGDGDSLAIGSDGNLYAWGANDYGELGDGTTAHHNSPEVITLAPGVRPTAIAVGGANSLAIGSDGNLYAWGANAVGELGDGTTTNHDSPEVITLAPGVRPTAIAVGDGDGLAIGSDGNLYAWGWNTDGELGDGTTTNHNNPEVITLAPGVAPTAISAGSYHNLAIGSDHKLYAWGYNLDGQLGDGSAVQHDSPEAITLATGVALTAIAAGYLDSLAIGSDGGLYAWGDNQYGELGDGTTSNHDSPERIRLASGITPTAIAAGVTYYDHNLAIGSDDQLYVWGFNGQGQLGDGTTTNHDSPEATTLALGVTPTAIAAGAFDSLAIGSATPPTNAPETPMALFLPAGAAAVFGGFWVATRRRRVTLVVNRSAD